MPLRKLFPESHAHILTKKSKLSQLIFQYFMDTVNSNIKVNEMVLSLNEIIWI